MSWEFSLHFLVFWVSWEFSELLVLIRLRAFFEFWSELLALENFHFADSYATVNFSTRKAQVDVSTWLPFAIFLQVFVVLQELLRHQTPHQQSCFQWPFHFALHRYLYRHLLEIQVLPFHQVVKMAQFRHLQVMKHPSKAQGQPVAIS